MTRQDNNWKSVCSKLPKKIFNSYFTGFKTQMDVAREFNKNNPDRHISTNTTILREAGYLKEDRIYDKVKKKRLLMNVGTVKPYLDYLKSEHPELNSKNISLLIQIFAGNSGIRQLVVKDDRDIITGINELLVLYWHTKNYIQLVKSLNKNEELTLFNVAEETDNFLAKQFIEFEIKEGQIWDSPEEQKNWWDKFIAAHGIDPSFMLTFKQILNRVISEGVKK